MLKLVLLCIFFLLALLVVFRAPTSLLWYVSILVTEFSLVFLLVLLAVFCWPAKITTHPVLQRFLLVATAALLLLPYVQAWWLGRRLQRELFASFPSKQAPMPGFPFQPLRMVTGLNKRKVAFQTLTYQPAQKLALDFYAAADSGNRPCVVVIHGGSWAGGNSRQLPELNSELAKAGYHVASINYRLAPTHRYPAPVSDVQAALRYLRNNATDLRIDKMNFVLLGRSAGGQIALSAAYTLADPVIRGVINFYGPTDMVWGYENPTNPLVLNSRKVMEDYLGGTLTDSPQAYRASSATETVTSNSPPTLLIYAGNDPLVSPLHGTKLAVRLKALQVPHYRLHLPWATHGFDYTLNGPGGQLSTWAVKAFLHSVFDAPRD